MKERKLWISDTRLTREILIGLLKDGLEAEGFTVKSTPGLLRGGACRIKKNDDIFEIKVKLYEQLDDSWEPITEEGDSSLKNPMTILMKCLKDEGFEVRFSGIYRKDTIYRYSPKASIVFSHDLFKENFEFVIYHKGVIFSLMSLSSIGYMTLDLLFNPIIRYDIEQFRKGLKEIKLRKSDKLYVNNAKFWDDHYDQIIMNFYNDLSMSIGPQRESSEDNPFKNPHLEIDLNEELDKKIRKMINSNYYYYYKDIPFDTLPSLFPEDFWERVRRWIAMHLNEFFFNEFHSYRSKFTSESIEMLIDIGTKIILGTDFLDFDDESIPPEIWRGMMISHIDEAVCVTEKADFNLLNLAIIFNVSIYSYERDNHYHNLIYWLDPREYVPIEEIGYDTLFLKSIPNILKKHPIPEKIFSEELKKRLMKFISEYTDFPPEWFKTISRLYLHFAYFGFVKGKIPGIKQGAYSSQQLEDQLRKLI